MHIQCPTCRSEVFSLRQKYWASAIAPLKCTSCGALAGPSWWAALILTSLPFVVIFGLWLSLVYRSWWPIAIAAALAAAGYHAAFRYMPLAPISRREVMTYRVVVILVLAFLFGGAVLSSLGQRVAL